MVINGRIIAVGTTRHDKGILIEVLHSRQYIEINGLTEEQSSELAKSIDQNFVIEIKADPSE